MTHLRELSALVEPSAALHAHGLFADAELHSGGSDRPFYLDDDSVWLVEDGEVDVFSVPPAGSTIPGRRAHLMRVSSGKALFALGPTRAGASRSLLGVGTSGARLRRMPQSEIRARAWSADNCSIVYTLVDQWVEALCTGITRGVLPKVCAELDSGTEVSVAEPTSARPRRGVTWMRHAEGHSLLFGQETLKLNGSFIPLSSQAWIRVTEASRIVLLETSMLPDPETLWSGLDRLHELVQLYATLYETNAATAMATRLRRKESGHQSALRDACASLAGSMRTNVGAPDLIAVNDPTADRQTERHEALIAACQRVGAALGVSVCSFPKSDDDSYPRDPIAAVARASRLRTRAVMLREQWWTSDNGPLVGAIGEDKRPVALIREKRRYVMHDLIKGTIVPVTAALAADFQPMAYTFYRPFPDVALSIRDVVRSGVRGCGPDLLMVVAMGVAGALLGLVPAMATGAMFNDIIPGAQRSQLIQLGVILVACAVSAALFNIVRGIALLRVESRMSATIQAAVWDRLLSLPMPFFRPYAAGDLAMRAMGIDAIRQVISGTTITAILGGLFSLFNFALMFSYSASMAWRATGLIAVAVTFTAVGSLLQLKHQRGIAAIQSKASGLVLQLLTSIAKLRVAGAEVTAFTLWARRFAAQRQLQYRARKIGNAVSAFNAAFPTLAFMLLFWTALPLVHGPQATMRTGDFLAFLSAYGSCQGALLGTCMALLSTLNVIPLYEQARPILSAQPEVNTAKSDPGSLVGDVEVQGVTFRYTSDGPPVLRSLSLRVRPGEFVAFVGPSGSGKSTILRLLLGFETPESGAIYFDGQELAGVDIQAVRRQIGVVLQNGRLLAGDIFSNIVGSAPLSMEDAWSAARMAGFAEDVQAMPMGMHTVVSDGGGTLSGGQRQRLMIARALVHRPRLLFFDEATSALDNRTQAIVSSSLEQLHATRIVVAHRLSTIINADRIYVVERGQIVQSGRYEELITQPGRFAELAKRQLA